MIDCCSRQRFMAGVLSGALLLGIFGGCAEPDPIKVRSVYGPGIRLDGIGRTFCWRPGTQQAEGATPIEYRDTRVLIQRTLEQDLVATGFQPVSQGTADFWIEFRVNRSIGGGTDSWDPAFNEGALIVDVVDPETKQLIWHGVAEARIDDADPPEVRRERIQQAIRLLMKRFPKQ